MTDSRYFCIRPFTHLQIEPNGEVKICCIATDVVRDGGRRMNLHVDSLDDVWRSDALTEIRRTLMADRPVRECERCNHFQAGSSGELRTVVNAEWDSRFPLARTVAELSAAPDQPRGPRPNEYQLNLGPLCNLKCRMCGTRYSSRIAEDPVFSRWADDYHPDSAVVGRWRGDKLALLPRYLLGAKYTGFGNGLWSHDRSLHRDMLGPATIALPRADDAVPTVLELGISPLNQGSFVGTVSINGTPVRRSEWFPGQQLRIDLPADATAGSGDVEIQLQALGFTPGPTGAGPLIESLVLHRARAPDAPRARNERAFLRHGEGLAWHDDPAILEELVADPKAVKHLILQGGEPMLIPATEWLIDRLIAAGEPQETSLQFVTNATIYKPALIEKLRRFRRVEMVCSVDGVGPVLEYIRYPARWTQVAETIERFCALGFVEVSIAVAAQIYNLFDLPNLLSYADEHGISVGLHFLSDPVRLNVLTLPPPAREPAIAALERHLAAHPTGVNRGVAEFVVEHLKSLRDKIIPGQLEDLFAFTNDLDDVNGQSIRAACPELVAALAAIGQPWGEQRLFSPAAAPA